MPFIYCLSDLTLCGQFKKTAIDQITLAGIPCKVHSSTNCWVLVSIIQVDFWQARLQPLPCSIPHNSGTVTRFSVIMYTRDRNVWGDRPFYLVKQPQEKWACDFHDDAPPLSFQLQVADVIF